MIKTVKLFEGEFKGQRTAYSANCMFIAILTNLKVKYDHEVIGEAIFPDGFGAMDPPGPSAGFGAIVLTDDEEDGKVVIADLKDREDAKGKIKSERAIKKSLKEYSRVRHQMTQVVDSYRARFKLATTKGSTGRLGWVF